MGELTQLPQDLVIEIVRMLDVSHVAALGAVNSVARQKVWQDPGVWSSLGARGQLDADAFFSGRRALSGAALREAFRRQTYKLDCKRVESLSAAVQDAGGTLLAGILQDLAHIASGLMPCDGAGLVESLCSAAEQALQAHDPTHAESAAAADKILRIVRRRDDLFCWLQRERLEYARASAVQLQALMEDLVDKAPETGATESLDALCVDDSAGTSFPPASAQEHRHHPLCGCGCANHGTHCDVVLEAAHEEQRLRELCALFGDLCSQALGDVAEEA